MLITGVIGNLHIAGGRQTDDGFADRAPAYF